MILEDFIFDGERLSDFECIVCSVLTNMEENVSLGSYISFETLTNNITHENKITKVSYDSPIVFNCDIIKKTPLGYEECYFTENEISEIMRWLNKTQYKKFEPIYEDYSYPGVYFMGTFNVKSIKLNGYVIGFSLEFTSDAPWGFVDKVRVLEIENGGNEAILFHDSEHEGILYPNRIKITCNEDADELVIKNLQDVGIPTTIKNCSKGENININCRTKYLETDDFVHSTIRNDFNYRYPRIIGERKDKTNTFSVSHACTIEFEYAAIRKVGIV